jgi:hypothetical protein
MRSKVFASLAHLEQQVRSMEIRALVAKARYLAAADHAFCGVDNRRAAHREWQELLSDCRRLEQLMLQADAHRDHPALNEHD